MVRRDRLSSTSALIVMKIAWCGKWQSSPPVCGFGLNGVAHSARPNQRIPPHALPLIFMKAALLQESGACHQLTRLGK